MSKPASLAATVPTALANPSPTWVRWRIVAILMAYSAMNHFNRVSMTVAGDERIMRDYGISPTAMGYVYSSFLLAYTICMAPGGWLVDRLGPHRSLLLMGFGTAYFTAVTGLVGIGWMPPAWIWPALLIVRACTGACAAPLYPSTGTVVKGWMPLRGKAWANGLILGAALLGIASVYRLFGLLIDVMGWPMAFLTAANATALIAFVWLLYGRDRPDQHPGVNEAERTRIQGRKLDSGFLPDLPPSQPAAGRSLWLNRNVLLLTLSYSAVGYFEYLFFYWMHHYFEEVLHLGKTASQYYAGIPSLAMAASIPLGGWLSDRLTLSFGRRVGRGVLSAAGMLASALFLVLGVFAQTPLAIVTWFALALGAVGLSESPFWTTAIELGGRRGGTTGGIVNTGGNAGGIVAPVLTPWVGQLFGWPWAISLGSLYCIIGALFWIWIDPDEQIE